MFSKFHQTVADPGFQKGGRGDMKVKYMYNPNYSVIWIPIRELSAVDRSSDSLFSSPYYRYENSLVRVSCTFVPNIAANLLE